VLLQSATAASKGGNILSKNIAFLSIGDGVGSSLIVVGICSTKVVFAYVTVNHTIPRNKYLF
jgi:hypothetical protein